MTVRHTWSANSRYFQFADLQRGPPDISADIRNRLATPRHVTNVRFFTTRYVRVSVRVVTRCRRQFQPQTFVAKAIFLLFIR